MQIKVKESTVVRPAKATPTRSLWLSSLDLVMPPHNHTHFIYFFRRHSRSCNNFFDSMVMKEALSQAIVHFYPIAGRLKIHNDRFEIDCNGQGALFVEAEADGAMDELTADFVPRPDLPLIPKVDYTPGISSFPLFLAQATRFKCGGVCLVVAVDHHVADGTSSAHFINSWADMARCQENVVAIPPVIDRKLFLSARDPPRPLVPHTNYSLPPTMKHCHKDDDVVFNLFKLTPDQIKSLKAKCKDCDATYTTYEVVSGHTWRCATIARKLPADQETKLNMAVDGRRRMQQPPLPQGYFGNVVFGANPTLLAGELQSNPLKFTVRKVHEAIARVNNGEYLRSTVDYFECGEADVGLLSILLHGYSCPNLILVSWAGLHLNSADFGWGQPIYVGPWGTPTDGSGTMLRANDGTVLYGIALYKRDMDVFEKLFYDI